MDEVRIRQAVPADLPAILELQHVCYPLLSTVALWREDHVLSHLRYFSAGQLVAEVDGEIVGHSASFRISGRIAFEAHTFREITDRGTFSRHDPDGDVLYGAEIMVHPDYRRKGIARAFYDARFDLMRRLGIRFFVAGGRLPGYADAAQRMTPDEYVDAVVEGRIMDRVLTPQLRSGLKVRRVLPNYLSDPNSRDFATLLVWENLDYRPRRTARTGRATTEHVTHSR